MEKLSPTTMSRLTILILTLLIALWSATCPAAGDFKVSVGGNNYEASDGIPFQITTPGGEQVEITISKQDILSYDDHGVRFNYSGEMKVLVDKDVLSTMITIECEASPFVMIQILPTLMEPSEVIDALIVDMEKNFKTMNAQFFKDSGGPVSMKIGGKEYNGRQLKFMLGGDATSTKVFSWNSGSKTYSFVVQIMEEDRELGDKYFPIILDSLSID